MPSTATATKLVPFTNGAPAETIFSNEIVEKHKHTIEEKRQEVWRLQDPRHQLRMLDTKVRAYVDLHYRETEAHTHLTDTLNYIFNDLHSDPIKAKFTVPERISWLLTNKPCIFTFFPGIGTHDSLSQYDITLGDRTSSLMSRSQVKVETQVTSDPRTHMNSFLLNAPMRSVVDPNFARMMVNEGLIVVYHRFKRPLDPSNCDNDPLDFPGDTSKWPTVQSEEECQREQLQLAREFGSRIFFSCGVLKEHLDFAKKLIDAGVLGICIDVALANSYQAAAGVLELKEYIRSSRNKNALIMVGNVDNEEGYFLMAACGADVIKVGIGPGSNCTTRGTTGAGKGQGSALMSAARAQFVFGDNAPAFIADGGAEGSVDVTRAIALGASCAMSGKLFTKCFESGALKKEVEEIVKGEKKLVLKAWSFGEASKWAQIYSRGGVKTGFAVEGKGAWIPVEYHFKKFIDDMRAEWRNSLTYYNAASASDLRQKFCIEQQLCDLILGGETGVYRASSGISREAGTRMV